MVYNIIVERQFFYSFVHFVIQKYLRQDKLNREKMSGMQFSLSLSIEKNAFRNKLRVECNLYKNMVYRLLFH